ncbi:hypothetical protein KSP40_PGU007676 [Platanthera guangdongensis]|uniref:GTD-binding domain-containing protein n=1 Tax=Platanthera guangdongensis TaxID=2320717 RepID=A0ABR2MGG9_9ASPA
MTEAEVIALKEALINQAQFIRELSDELDEERKAAASGADEALSMIFRLQEGRALQKMEAVQFKRIAEAKMLHTEELLAFLKESILEKDGEISTLKLQLQSYRQNMQRYGICDTDVEEISMNSLQSDFEQLRIRLEKIENDQKIMKEEDSKRNYEQLNLLRGVHDQLKAMQAQTKVQKIKGFLSKMRFYWLLFQRYVLQM